MRMSHSRQTRAHAPLQTTRNDNMQDKQSKTETQAAVALQPLVSLPAPFTPKEWHDISLCVGWTVAMSEGHDEPSLERRTASMRAMAAMKRVLGAGFHTRIVEANAADQTPP